MTVYVDHDKCCTYEAKCSCNSCSCTKVNNSCKMCVDACPTGAIKNDCGIVIEQDLCNDCGVCIDACSNGALYQN